MLISADCIAPNNIAGRFYNKLINFSESAPYNNAPVMCPVAGCNKIVWRWNMQRHYQYNHKNVPMTANLIISEFEKYCVKLISIKGYIKKKDFNDILLKKYSDLTKDTFPKMHEKFSKDNKKKKKKNNKNKSHHNKKKRNDKEEASDNDNDEQKEQQIQIKRGRFDDSDESE